MFNRISTQTKICTILLCLWGITCIGQENVDGKRLTLGLYIGSTIANAYSAPLYDGYGVDIDGNRNSYSNSWMYQKIITQYGGYASPALPDQIAEALNVDYHTWTFSSANMPSNMRYQPGITIGLNTRYSVDNWNGIIMNINLSRITASGNFTIETPQAPNSGQLNDFVNTFSIIGVEQRMVLLFGYQRIFEQEGKVNYLIEGGLNATVAKMARNFIVINDLTIDLTTSLNDAINAPNALPIQKPIGVGFGAFAGIGIDVSTSDKYSAQLVYNPSMEKINIGAFPAYKLQHAIGLRFYYNL